MLLATAVATSLAACGGDQTPEYSYSIPGKSDPFSYTGNMIKSELKIDGSDADELWSDPSVTKVRFSSCDVSILRRDTAIYFYFKVYDITPYSYVNEGAADEVTHSDSIEIYIDSLLGRYDTPQANCYQINFGRDGRTRILSGSGGIWYKWEGMYNFEAREGFNTDYDYYFIEAMIPVAQLGIGATEDIGVAFGHVDRHIEENVDLEAYYKWNGMDFDNKFIDPQVPKLYPVLRATGGDLLTYEQYLAQKPRA